MMEVHNPAHCAEWYAPDGARGMHLAKAVAKLLLQREGAAPLEWDELARRLHNYDMDPKRCPGFSQHLSAHVAVLHELQRKPGWEKALGALVGE